MKKGLFLIVLLVISVFAQGCVDSTKNNDSQGALSFEFKLQDVATSSLEPQTLSTTRLAQINTAKMWVTEIQFSAEGSSGSVGLSFEANSEVNLIDGIFNPEIGSMILEEGKYTNVYFGVEILDTDNFIGITLEGTLSENTPFRLEFTSGEVFEAEADILMIDANNKNVALITFDPMVWFSTITANEWDSAERNENGVILITEEVNANLFEKIATSLDNSTEATFPGGELN